MQESGFAHVRRMLMGDVPQIRSVGILTAQNPAFDADIVPVRNGEWTREDPDYNEKANFHLFTHLRSANYGPIKSKGMFQNREEDTFIVPNMPRSELVELGKRYGKEAVIWGEKRTDKSENPYFKFEYIQGNETLSIRSVHMGGEDVQSREDLYTMIKGRKFIIPFFGDVHARKVPGMKYGTALDVPKTQATPWDADELAGQVETFFIPLFDDPNVELDQEETISYCSDKLADDPYVKELVDEIHRREEKLKVEGATHKTHWICRGVIWECMEKLRWL